MTAERTERHPLVTEAAARGPLWVITPCKGRLKFVQKTAERVIQNPIVKYCLVDYSCPEKVGDWVEQRFVREMRAGRVVVERVTGDSGFNKCRAHNAGARRAIAEGAEYLCFLDADTRVEPGFHEFIRKHLHPDRFLIAGLREDGSDMPSMTGLLVVRACEFERVGGFDEGFAGWGGEDIELRLRLCLLGGLDYTDVPLSLTNPMPHGNELRTQFYSERSIATSNSANMMRVHNKVAFEWKGRMVRSLSEADRLWFQHASVERWANERYREEREAERDFAPTPAAVERPLAAPAPRPRRDWTRNQGGSPRLAAAAALLHRDREDSW